MGLPDNAYIAAVLTCELASRPDRKMAVCDAYSVLADVMNLDRETTAQLHDSGHNLWQVRVRSVAKKMKDQGILRPHPLSGRGWYELSEKPVLLAGDLLKELDEYAGPAHAPQTR